MERLLNPSLRWECTEMKILRMLMPVSKSCVVSYAHVPRRNSLLIKTIPNNCFWKNFLSNLLPPLSLGEPLRTTPWLQIKVYHSSQDFLVHSFNLFISLSFSLNKNIYTHFWIIVQYIHQNIQREYEESNINTNKR